MGAVFWGLALGGMVWWAYRTGAAAGGLSGVSSAVSDAVYNATGLSMSTWEQDLNDPNRGGPYKAAIAAAEQKYGLPTNLLARQLWQESRFRPEIINCQLDSGAGAEGIAQIIPKWNPGVNPCDPFAAIDYAAADDARLYAEFGTWEYALQAYNWGDGNLRAYLAGQVATMPLETSNYSAQILGDIGMA